MLQVSGVVVEVAARRPRDARRRVLDGLTIEVAAGGVVAVAGPPAFGGTTVARMIAGLVVPGSGCVRINGDDVTATPAAVRPVAFVPAGGGLLPHRTARENIVYGLRLRSAASVLIRTRFAGVVERLELQSSLDLRPHDLSPGQRLRTALARAAMRNAQVLVVDATTGAQAVDQFRPMIERVRAGSRMAVLMCTNRPDLLDPADPVVWISAGAAGPTRTLAELRRAPPDLATATAVYGPGLEVYPGVIADGHIEHGVSRLAAPPGLADGVRVHIAVAPRPRDSGPRAAVAADPVFVYAAADRDAAPGVGGGGP